VAETLVCYIADCRRRKVRGEHAQQLEHILSCHTGKNFPLFRSSNPDVLTEWPVQYYNHPKRLGTGKKPVFLDPSYPARREKLLDAPGRDCLSVRDVYGGKVIVLGCQPGGEAEVWVNVINMLFTAAKSRGGGSRGDPLNPKP
jgi:hypothetical protein